MKRTQAPAARSSFPRPPREKPPWSIAVSSPVDLRMRERIRFTPATASLTFAIPSALRTLGRRLRPFGLAGLPAIPAPSARPERSSSDSSPVPSRSGSHDKDATPDPSALRVLLVDDHVLVRAGVRALLEDMHGFQVVGEARDGLEALELVESAGPRVVVTDLIMPGLGGLETTRQIRERHPEIDVVILSMYCDEEQVHLALAGGARGFVRKSGDVSRLADAIRKAAQGGLDYSDVVAEARLQELLHLPNPAGRYESLTPREREILHFAAWGYTSIQIADRLVISPRTVETHRAHLLRKLGLRNQVDLIFFAIRHGVLTPESAEALRARDRLVN